MCPFALQPSGKRGQRSALRLAGGGVGGQGGQGLGLTRKDEIRPHQSGSVIFAGLSGGPVLRAGPGSEQWASPSQLAAPGLAREVSFHGTDVSWRWGMPCKSSSASQRAPATRISLCPSPRSTSHCDSRAALRRGELGALTSRIWSVAGPHLRPAHRGKE